MPWRRWARMCSGLPWRCQRGHTADEGGRQVSEHHDMAHGWEVAHGRSGRRGHDAAEHHSGGGGGHHAHMVADFRRRFWVSLILSIPVLALAPLIQAWLGLSERLAFPGDRSVQAVFATIIYLYGGWPFLGESSASCDGGSPA